MLALGCVMFSNGNYAISSFGRLLQGAGAAFAFTGAVYIATKSFPAAQLASVIGIVQAFGMFGMFGGSAGQYAVAQLVHQFSVPWFYVWYGLAGLLVALALMMFCQREPSAPTDMAPLRKSPLDGYRVVFSNPQSWLCGICAGLLFIPTTVGDMIWRVAFRNNPPVREVLLWK